MRSEPSLNYCSALFQNGDQLLGFVPYPEITHWHLPSGFIFFTCPCVNPVEFSLLSEASGGCFSTTHCLVRQLDWSRRAWAQTLTLVSGGCLASSSNSNNHSCTLNTLTTCTVPSTSRCMASISSPAPGDTAAWHCCWVNQKH